MLIFPNLIFSAAQLYLAEAASEEAASATYHPHFFLLLVTLTYKDKHLCKPNSFVFVLSRDPFTAPLSLYNKTVKIFI